MEQAAGSLDDLQPQDLSTSSLPTVIDLTRKGEECVLNTTSLQMVKNPGWYPNSGTSNPGLACGSSDIILQSGDHIQPDNAFSHTTVTLSYVSRSHVFSTQDSLSQHSPLCGIPPMSKFSLHPPCDSDKGLGETGYSLSTHQHYMEQVEGPVDLVTQTELLQSQAQVGPENDGGVCPTQELHEVNGGVISTNEDMDKRVEKKVECSLSWKSSRCLENGGGDSQTSSGEGVESSPETVYPTTVENDEGGGSEVLLVMSRKQDPVVPMDSVRAGDRSSLSREYVSPLEDPISPSTTSLNDVEDVFILPQASSSPSADTSCLESEAIVWDSLSTEGAIQSASSISNSTAGGQTPDCHPPHKWERKGCAKDIKREKAATAFQQRDTTKAAHTPRRRRKKHKGGQSSSIFSPKEPEIKLKYLNYKEEKRDLRLDSFSPFVRVERQQSSPSLCTVINYPEDVRVQHKKGQQQQQGHPCGFIPAVVPSTSCLQLGRASMQSKHQRSLVCCLCGQSANAIDLGDLHGPYYPEGYQPSSKTPASTTDLKENEDDYSDSDVSSYSTRGRKRKCASPRSLWSHRPGAQLKLRENHHLVESHWRPSDSTGSPAAKQTRLDGSSADVEDWYSPPVLPLEPCEYWLHEDCGIWSAGVFLVKGKVYGLEEAVKMSQETTVVCDHMKGRMCTACRDPGATLGCFFKGCPNKYHYRCALESTDCVLNEENFSMKCKKHKNKTLKTPPGSRWDDRHSPAAYCSGSLFPFLLVTMETVDQGSSELAPTNLNFTLCPSAALLTHDAVTGEAQSPKLVSVHAD
ncbi:hypothetical protein INR49_000932 [Caranx melampygus]|nr:hypothetical protein INR49_000932 [Caranx melampygus]